VVRRKSFAKEFLHRLLCRSHQGQTRTNLTESTHLSDLFGINLIVRVCASESVSLLVVRVCVHRFRLVS